MDSDAKLATSALSAVVGQNLTLQSDGCDPPLGVDTLLQSVFSAPPPPSTAGYSSGPPIQISPDFFDPKFDFDFTLIKDGQRSFTRGGEAYKRPCGWRRFAIKVVGKYESEAWLGSSNALGEWPVSYHGTAKHNGQSISELVYDLSKGVRFKHGREICSSPDIAVAEKFAKTFSHNGQTYKVVLQNRVNPENIYKIPGLGYWICPDESDIRQYGICIKRV